MCQIGRDDRCLYPSRDGRAELQALIANRNTPRKLVWRSLKYECVDLHACEPGSEAKAGVVTWIAFHDRKRPHSALGGKPPAVVHWLRKYETKVGQQVQRVA